MTRPPTEARSRTSRALRLAACLTTLCLVLAVAPAAAQWWNTRESVPEPDYPEITVTPGQLTSLLGRRDVVVLDARSRDDYLAGHVPGALSAPADELPCADSVCGIEKLAGLLGELGLGGRERLVCAGASSTTEEAAALFWALELAGAANVVVLDGGVKGWLEEGHTLSTAAAALEPVTWARTADLSVLATREYVRRHYGEAGHEVVDARGEVAWMGPVEEDEWSAPPRAGHVPHALPFDFGSFFGPEGDMLDAGECWRLFGSLGPRPANPVHLGDEFIVHGWGCDCEAAGDPGAAVYRMAADDEIAPDGALAYFLLRRAGIERVRLYPGGWRDWSGDPYLPVVRIIGAEELAERLRAERRWLRPGGPAADFAFFDVRHPADHERGHIRGAVSLRSDYFADSLDVRMERYWPEADRQSMPVVTYCYGDDCIRSRATSTDAARAGFVRIERLKGGLDEWRSAGGSLVQGR